MMLMFWDIKVRKDDFLMSIHRCTQFENPGGGSGRFLLNFGREGI
jgi:hypothetical protein